MSDELPLNRKPRSDRLLSKGGGCVWPRSDPAELEKFDPRTKKCTMNCGPSSLDPRSKKERLFQCTDCSIQPRRIITHYFGPPIPTRCFDYRAQYEDADETDQFGWGPTPEDAITDLRQKEQDS